MHGISCVQLHCQAVLHGAAQIVLHMNRSTNARSSDGRFLKFNKVALHYGHHVDSYHAPASTPSRILLGQQVHILVKLLVVGLAAAEEMTL